MSTFVINAISQTMDPRRVYDGSQYNNQYPLGTRVEGIYTDDAGRKSLMTLQLVTAANDIGLNPSADEEARFVQGTTSPPSVDVPGSSLSGVQTPIGALNYEGYHKDDVTLTTIPQGDYFWVIAKGVAAVKMPSADVPVNGDRIGYSGGGAANKADASGEGYLGYMVEDGAADDVNFAMIDCLRPPMFLP